MAPGNIGHQWHSTRSTIRVPDAIEGPRKRELLHRGKLRRSARHSCMPRYRRRRSTGPARVARGSSACPKASTSTTVRRRNLFKAPSGLRRCDRGHLEREPEANSCGSSSSGLAFASSAPALRAKLGATRVENSAFVPPRSEHRKFLPYVAAADVRPRPVHSGEQNYSCDALCPSAFPWSPCRSQLPGRFTRAWACTRRSISTHASPRLGRRVRGNRAAASAATGSIEGGVANGSGPAARACSTADDGWRLGEGGA